MKDFASLVSDATRKFMEEKFVQDFMRPSVFESEEYKEIEVPRYSIKLRAPYFRVQDGEVCIGLYSRDIFHWGKKKIKVRKMIWESEDSRPLFIKRYHSLIDEEIEYGKTK